MAKYALYMLEKVTDNPLYEGFAFADRKSLRGKRSIESDFLTDDVQTQGRAWTVTRMATLWKPQPVVGRVRAWNDFPCVSGAVPAFSRRAVDALRDFLEPNGELLPLVSNIGEYYAYNVTTVADVLDQERSDMDWGSGTRVCPNGIGRYECVADRLDGLSIFRIVERLSDVHVTQVFFDRVKAHRLHGFHFCKLWPLPPGVKWLEEDYRLRQKYEQIAPGTGRPIKGNSVVIHLPLSKSKPTAAEKEKLTQLLDELDSVLYNPLEDRDAPYFGSLEGYDWHAGEYRVALSCPDADALVEALRPWLRGTTWGRKVTLVKRSGEYFDDDCPEEIVEL